MKNPSVGIKTVILDEDRRNKMIEYVLNLVVYSIPPIVSICFLFAGRPNFFESMKILWLPIAITVFVVSCRANFELTRDWSNYYGNDTARGGDPAMIIFFSLLGAPFVLMMVIVCMGMVGVLLHF